MTVTPTGHAEIDHQHEILDETVAQLARFCPQVDGEREPSCRACGPEQRRQCSATLTSTVDELGAFLVGHATYEERMMELLPDTPECRTHVRAHKAAHQGVERQLRKLAGMVAREEPLTASAEIWKVIGHWLGDHTSLFDRRLVHMAGAAPPEINLDNELVVMLDRHVFPNRPVGRHNPEVGKSGVQKARMETRGRFESLTPAQRSVFWLVVGGKRNREIADSLGISTNTVKTHRAAIFQKMGVASVVELVKKTDGLR